MRSWLRQVGVTGLEYVGEGFGPPDFVGVYDGDCVAVEVMRLLPSVGWGVTKERGFARELRTLIAQAYQELPHGPRWHVVCEYAPSQPCPAPSSSDWRRAARRALTTPGPGGAFPLLRPAYRKGDGLELVLTPATDKTAIGHLREHEPFLVTSALGSAPVQELVEELPRAIAEKAVKVRARTRHRSCLQWWLVLDDDILIAPSSILGCDERGHLGARRRVL